MESSNKKNAAIAAAVVITVVIAGAWGYVIGTGIAAVLNKD